MTSPVLFTVDAALPRRRKWFSTCTALKLLLLMRGGRVETPSVFCHGFHWNLEVYPNGDKESKGYVSLFLACGEVKNGIVESVRAKFTIRVASHPLSRGIKTYSKKTSTSWGAKKYCSCAQALSYCDARGTLSIEVSLQVYPQEQEVNCWKPEKNNGAKLASLYHSKICSDATFVVEDSRFEVHRLILELNAPTLAGMLGNDTLKREDVPLAGVDPNLFEMMIRYLYTEDLPPDFNDEDHALDLLQLADKFGCPNLKMLLEARIVESNQIFCPANAADLLATADAKNCALLLERSLNLIVESIPNVYDSEGWKHVEESPKLMKAIISAQSNRMKNNRGLESASVSELRKRAFEQQNLVDIKARREDRIKFLLTTLLVWLFLVLLNLLCCIVFQNASDGIEES